MRLVLRLLAVVCCLLVSIEGACGEEPALHGAIDKMILAGCRDVTIAPPSGDAEFLRRIYLDLAGRIPSVDETKQFLANESADKRGELIDRLLDGPDYPRRMQELFHAMLMERRGNNDEWTRFLRTAFERNTPWDQMVQSIIRPDTADEATRGAAYFLTSRLVSEGAMAPVDVPGLTRDVGRLLAGIDLGCAQCHDHVSIDDYKQLDFQGLHMIFENLQTRRDVPFPALAEKVMTQEKEFMSVFTQVARTTSPRVVGGGSIAITTFPKGEEYDVPPDPKKRTPGVPKFSPLKELAAQLASGDNTLFCRNIVNRLWFVMMGRGLVEPLDLQHGDNLPTHPELLDLLAGELAAHNFDIQWLLRELARTDCYQRSSVLPSTDGPPPWKSYAVANEKRLNAEQLFWSTLVATGELDRIRRAAGSNQEAAVDAETLVAESTALAELQKQFLDTFANPPKEAEIDFEPTVKAALFLMHDQRVLALVRAQDGNLVDRLAKLPDATKIAEELFLNIVTRTPSQEEIEDVKGYLLEKQGDQRAEAIGHLAWALLASTEFCVNH